MRVVDCVQGTQEWVDARAGVPTSSNFHKVITPKTRKRSAAQSGYLCQLMAERLMGTALDSYISDYMERGKDLEDQAFAYYEMQRGMDVEKVGFVLHDTLQVGCSPDGLVGNDGGLELKCPSPAVHVSYMLDGLSDEYRCQVQGSLWITGRGWWDLMSFHPDLPPALLRVYRDDEFITDLSREVTLFASLVDEAERKLADEGHINRMRETA